IFFSNEEYYRKLEELKEAHLQTMADLESMQGLRRSRSAADLRRSSSDNGLLFSPGEYIRNMWRDFQVPPHTRQLSSSLRSLPAVPRRQESQQEPQRGGGAPPRPRTTVPRPFQMTLREDERRRRGVRSRVEVETENRELRRQLEELTECQKQFRASPVPAHVYLARYAEQQEQQRRARLQERQSLTTVPKPFSFLERERLRKEQREQSRPPPEPGEAPAFKAKPVPPSVYAAASGERLKEEQLYRSIQIHRRAQELLQSAAPPPSRVARRLNQRKKSGEGGGSGGGDGFAHRPQINREVPDFEASYRCFQDRLQKRRRWRATTTCQPFQLRTAHIPSHRERVLADLEREQSSPRELRWPFLGPGPPQTPASSLCSSLSGSLELLPTKVTGATRKRHEAVR
ncbi:unnamed protein product, partial [Tetraodon nigroviridis]